MIEAYTIGNTKSYDEALSNDPEHANKLGVCDDYEGGWIWKTYKEANNFIHSDEFSKVNWSDGKTRNPKNFSVYKVLLENGYNDIYHLKTNSDNTFNLLINSRFTKC